MADLKAIKSQLKDPTPPDISRVLDAAKRDVKVAMNCVNIGIIQEFNPDNQTATIQIALKQVINIAPNGTKTFQEIPLILQCPVVVLFGGGSYLTMPIEPGDNCLVLFNDREIDNWLYNGGVQAPTSARIHDVSDAIALVGLRSFQNSITDYLVNGVRLSFAPDSRIDLTEDAINSIAELFTHTGDMLITGNLTIIGDTYGDGDGNINLNANIIQSGGHSIHAGNGANGTFNVVTVVDGIVVSGS